MTDNSPKKFNRSPNIPGPYHRLVAAPAYQNRKEGILGKVHR